MPMILLKCAATFFPPGAHNTVRVDAKDQNRLKNYAWKEEDIREKADLKWKLGPVWDYGRAITGRGMVKIHVRERSITGGQF